MKQNVLTAIYDRLVLLNASLDFRRLDRSDYLYGMAAIFALVTIILVLATYINLHSKKKQARFKKNISESIEEWITEILMSDSSSEFTIPDNFKKIFQKPAARQVLIDELVRNKTSFLGSVGDNIIKLYYVLGLNVDSLTKLDNPQTHIQCQGIHELCVMEQKNYVRKVYRLTNSEDSDVRIEAQTAIIQWYGFKGLRFLDMVSYPISEFQQLKLLELLRQLSFSGFSKLDKWLTSSNDTVVDFALKLAEHYKQVQINHEAEQCLRHKNEAVRVQAVKTLAIIGNAYTAELFTRAYHTEKFTNKLNILKQLPKVVGEKQKDFLVLQLHEGNEFLRLESAKVLAECINGGMALLETISYENPATYKDIYLHVKSEATR